MSRTLLLGNRLFKADLSTESTADADPRHIRDARAWNQATDRHCAEIARQTGIRAETIRAWGRPQSEDRESPTSRMHRVLRASRECGTPEADVLAPVALIASDFHRGLAARVPIVGQLISPAQSAARMLREVSEAIGVTADGLPGGFTREERDSIKRELREAMDAIAAFDAALDQTGGNAP